MPYEGEGREIQFQELERLRAAFKAAREAAANSQDGSKERLEHLRSVEALDQTITRLKLQLGLRSQEEWAGPETEKDQE